MGLHNTSDNSKEEKSQTNGAMKPVEKCCKVSEVDEGRAIRTEDGSDVLNPVRKTSVTSYISSRSGSRNCSESSIYCADFDGDTSECGNATGMNLCRRRGSASSMTNYQPLSEKILTRIESGEPFFSLEFFPPRTKSGAANLLGRLVISSFCG